MTHETSSSIPIWTLYFQIIRLLYDLWQEQSRTRLHVHVMSTSKVLFSSELNMFLANVLNIDKLEKFREVEVTIILFQSLTIRLKYDPWKVLVLQDGVFRVLASLNLVRPWVTKEIKLLTSKFIYPCIALPNPLLRDRNIMAVTSRSPVFPCTTVHLFVASGSTSLPFFEHFHF